MIKQWIKRNKGEKGISLIEILVALLISSILIIAVANLYGGIRKSSREQDNLSLAQDRANFVLNELSRQVRMAGAGLCSQIMKDSGTFRMNPKFTEGKVQGQNVYSTIDFLKGLDSYHDMSLRSFPISSSDASLSSLTLQHGSDALVVMTTSANTLRITSRDDEQSATSFSYIPKIGKFAPLGLSGNLSEILPDNAEDVWLMVSDCNHSEVAFYKQPDMHKNKLEPPSEGGAGNFQYNYYRQGQVALVARVEGKIYFVAKNRTNGNWTLYEKDLLAPAGSAAIAMMDGIYSLKIDYLYESGGKTEWHTTAQRIVANNWNETVPVRITVTTDDGVSKDTDRRTFVRIIDPRN